VLANAGIGYVVLAGAADGERRTIFNGHLIFIESMGRGVSHQIGPSQVLRGGHKQLILFQMMILGWGSTLCNPTLSILGWYSLHF